MLTKPTDEKALFCGLWINANEFWNCIVELDSQETAAVWKKPSRLEKYFQMSTFGK